MKVSIAQFKYDKGVGTPTKQRKLLVLSKPSDSYFGIEFEDDTEVENFVEYLKEKEILEAYLKHKFNLAEENYKRFKVNKIVCLTEGYVTV